ncbi:4-oxalocrotonate tautomerase family protein [Kutzneria kofuensis]|uniref:4-oxalocrotonate tautomerase n=1 Tax=Kutzneria kofuensis TaxID=103725 RepID=A0A7W9KSA2_9PSEU|nr:tautomerase family protein [Kutzneria kofuensis]MBB5897782.1 4-oxalocrotonate tautomerase [Kutzneria kofuensis]
MPQIQVTLLKGRPQEEITALGKALTEAAASALAVAPEVVRVSVVECEPTNWFVGGESMAQRRGTGHA